MGSASDIEELLPKAMAELRDAKRGSVWKPLAAALVTFVGSLGGGAFAAGRYFEHASAMVEEHERAIRRLEGREDEDRNKLAQTWDVAIAGKAEAERQRDRMDAHTNTRTAER